MIDRIHLYQAVLRSLKRSQVTAILGPRQSGKTTLAHLVAEQRKAHFFDLEDPHTHVQLENAKLILEPLKGLIVIDEIQRRPELFPLLRVLSDRKPLPSRFLLLGSASPDIIRSVSETLAGRIEFIEINGFTLQEVGNRHQKKLWIRGEMPRSFLARSAKDSFAWRENFIRTFLERDIPQLGFKMPAITMHSFWSMLAHYQGQCWNASEIGNSLGLHYKVVRDYLGVLCGTFVVRQLLPWHENLKKREVKSPKIYIQDTGLLHSLLLWNL